MIRSVILSILCVKPVSLGLRDRDLFARASARKHDGQFSTAVFTTITGNRQDHRNICMTT